MWTKNLGHENVHILGLSYEKLLKVVCNFLGGNFLWSQFLDLLLPHAKYVKTSINRIKLKQTNIIFVRH